MTTELVARHWIGGQWTTSGAQKQTIDPATGDVIGTFYDADATQAEHAIDVAAETFQTSPWRSDAMLRATALSHLADAYSARLDEVIDTLCRENGKLRYEAGYEASFIPRALRFAAGLAVQNFGRVLDTRPGQQSMSICQPVGVAGLIIPWNSPAYLFVRALAPALAAGCTVTTKMPSLASRSAALAGEILSSVPELADGVVNIFIESGDVGARLLVDSPRVPVVSFTGSTRTGRLIALAAAARLKRVGLELGGKTPHVVFDDADLGAVLPTLEKSSSTGDRRRAQARARRTAGGGSARARLRPR